MDVERNAVVSRLALNGLGSLVAAFGQAREDRKKLLGRYYIGWDQIKTYDKINQIVAGLRVEIRSSVDFAREFGVGDFQIVKTFLQNVPAEQRPQYLTSMLNDPQFVLTPEEKFSLLVTNRVAPAQST